MDREFRNGRAQGLATILAMGKANPANCILQADYPNYYTRVTNSQHMTELHAKFKRMCETSMIRKRHMFLTEQILKENPNIFTYGAPSLNARQDILVKEVPILGKEAALEAIKEWGQPISKITHLIFHSISGVNMPGADYQLTKSLGLAPSIKRMMLYQQGCYVTGTILRIAKDIVENNTGARVLLVCSDILSVSCFHGPTFDDLSALIGQTTISDGAAALIVGADPDLSVERPLFQLVSAAQTLLPNPSDDDDGPLIEGQLREMGLTIGLSKEVPTCIAENIERCLVESFASIKTINGWNDLFWIVHPGGAGILRQIELKVGLREEKLGMSRHVLREHGNMGSASVFFILDEMRRKSIKEGKSTTGEGLEWGVLFGIGAGITVETIVLRSFPTVD